MAEVLKSPQDLAERVQRVVAMRDSRGLILIVQVPRAARPEAEAQVGAALRALGVEAERVRWVDVHPQQVEALRDLNRERDLLLRAGQILLLAPEDAAAVRLLRSKAPDLTAAPDLWVELASPSPERPWPEVEQELRVWATQQHSVLDLTGLVPGDVELRRVPLARVFINLLELTPEGGVARNDPPVPTPQRGGDLSLSGTASGRPLGQRAPRRPWLLLADPGAGKTTTLRHLALAYASGGEDPLHVGPLVPILIPLGDVAAASSRDRVQALPSAVARWLTERGHPLGGEPVEHLHRVLLLLDGLDEMPEPGARQAVLEEVAGLVQRGALGGAVVSGRTFLVDELRAASNRYGLAHLRRTSTEDIQSYLSAFIAARGRPSPEKEAQALFQAISGDRDLLQLAQTPLLLLFLALLHELEGRLPDRRVELYARMAELLIDRWVRARSLSSVGTRRLATRGEAWRVLGPLAWWVLDQGGGAVPRAQLERKLTELEAQREPGEDAAQRAQNLLRLLRTDSALLRPEPGDRWGFVHTSVAEFFAGRDASRDPIRWRSLVTDPFRPDRREVVIFAAGFMGTELGDLIRVDELVEAVLRGARRAGRYESRHPSLLIGLLREDPGLTRAQLRRLLGRLLEFWFKNYFSEVSGRTMQREALEFLDWAAESGLRAEVKSALEQALAPHKLGSIPWERLLSPSLWGPDDEPIWRLLVASLNPQSLTWTPTPNPFITALPLVLRRYGLDPTPLLNCFAEHTDWRLRWVAEHDTLDAPPPIRF